LNRCGISASSLHSHFLVTYSRFNVHEMNDLGMSPEFAQTISRHVTLICLSSPRLPLSTFFQTSGLHHFPIFLVNPTRSPSHHYHPYHIHIFAAASGLHVFLNVSPKLITSTTPPNAAHTTAGSLRIPYHGVGFGRNVPMVRESDRSEADVDSWRSASVR
jgi:hypothetical protein